MKNTTTIVLFITLLLSACSNEEKKLELFSPDAFAFSLENGWELNASVQVRGFLLEEEDDKYTARLSYYLNLITPSGELLEEITTDTVTEESNEEIVDLSIDAQVELDSSFATGEYKIIFYVSDDHSGKEVFVEKVFVLE